LNKTISLVYKASIHQSLWTLAWHRVRAEGPVNIQKNSQIA